MSTLKKIVAIGPESTGKSSLCQALASHYGTLWCPEYARDYLLENDNNYLEPDLEVMAKGQIALEELHAKEAERRKDPFLFIDTDMYVMKVWSEYSFERCAHFILDQIAKRRYDLYLLCHIDLPWTPDILREYPDLQNRQELFRIYQDLLEQQSVPFVDITGGNFERIKPAIRAIDERYSNEK